MRKRFPQIKSLSVIGGLTAILGISALAVFIYLSGVRTLSQLEVTLFTILVVILQTAFGVYTGILLSKDRARSEYQPFVRSALRRTYGLSEGLTRVQDNVREGVRRMSTRARMDSTSRAQLWGEIMNLIHCQISELLRQAQASIVDWREMGSEEIEKLEESARKKEEEISEISGRITELYKLMSELSTFPADTTPAIDRIEGVTSSLERELAVLRSSSILTPTITGEISKGDTRKLLLIGAFEEATEAYSQLIDLNPTSHSLYIGRARARYLSGDKEGALSDLEIAESLQPADPVIKKARQQILKGESMTIAVSAGISPNLAKANEGHAALLQGRLEDARRRYEEAKELGLSPAFANFDIAMVEVMRGNRQAALEFLQAINPELAGPFMLVQVEAIRLLCNIIDEGDLSLEPLKAALSQCPEFQLNKSPLRFLQAGLTNTDKIDDKMKTVFARLTFPSDHLNECQLE